MKLTRTTFLLAAIVAVPAITFSNRSSSPTPSTAMTAPPVQSIQSASDLPKTWLVDSEVAGDYLDMTWQVEGDSPVAAQAESCVRLTKHETRVIFGAQTEERRQQVQRFLDANPDLPGVFCINARNRRVWLSQKIPNVSAAINFFDRAISVGLVQLVKVTRTS